MRRLFTILVGALLVLTACGGGPDPSPPTPTAQSVVDAPFRCPDPTSTTLPPDRGSGSLPSAPTAAQLCLRDNRIPWNPPRGVLITGLDHLVDVVNEQEVHHPDQDEACGGVGAPAWFLVFRYADGIRTISGDNGGCWDLLVGNTERLGSRHVYQAYVAAVLRQRLHQSPPDILQKAPACPRRKPGGPTLPYATTSPAAQTSRVVVGTWCRRAGNHWADAGTATDAQLALLRHDIATRAHRRHGLHLGGCHGLPSTTHTLLVGRDPWGDPLAVDFTCDLYRLYTAPFPRARFVRMLPGTAAMVASVHNR
jgi:hypothetical protein